jgi:hypothetical protein
LSDTPTSRLLRALRIPSDEVQLARLIAAACATSGRTCREFLEAVLRLGTKDPSRAGRNADKWLRTMPQRVGCEQQQRLYEGRTATSMRRIGLGTVDLVFSGDSGWNLLCELKINSPYGKDQRERYVRAGHPLVCLVRRRTRASEELALSDAWLGEVLWEDLRPHLESLYLPGDAATLWRQLVRLIAEDGDFSRRAPKPQTTESDDEIAAALEREIKELLRRRLSQRPGYSLGVPESFLLDLETDLSRAGEWVLVEVGDSEPSFVVGAHVRRTATQTPEVEVQFDCTRVQTDAEATRLVDEGFQRIPPLEETIWLWRRTLAADEILAVGARAAVLAAVEDALGRLVRAGAFEGYLET